MGKFDSSLGITWVSVGVNVGLGAAKCLVGWLGNSTALLADGLHSLLDLVTDLAVVAGLKVSALPSDFDHPYGHQKFSTMGTLFIAGVLVFSSVGVIASSAPILIEGSRTVPSLSVLWVALVSLLVKEFLFWRTRRVARRLKSRILMANAWHHRTDSLTSLLVVIAIGTILLMGEKWALLDEVAGIALGGYLGFEGFKMMRQAFDDLVDAAPEAEIINDLREHILPAPGVVAYHDFRARRTGDSFEVDFHLQVDPGLSVKEGHDVAKKVKNDILSTHPEVLHVLVHVEPATDEHIRQRGISDSKSVEI